MKLTDILAECKRIARLSYADYGDREYYNADHYQINKDRLRVIKRFGFFNPYTEIVGVSRNGRLEISADSLEYKAGQYAPTEIYDALYSLLELWSVRDFEQSIIDGVASN